MRVVVVEQNGSGGLIHYAYQMCTAFAEAGAEVTLVTAKDYELEAFPHNFKVERRLRLWSLFERPLQDQTGSRIARVLRRLFWNVRRAVRALRLIGAWWSLTGYLIRMRPDIVQFGKINFPFEAWFLHRMQRRGLVLGDICHEFERREQSSALARYLDGLYASIFESFEALFFHAEENRARFHEMFDVPHERTHIIPHGNESMFLKHAAALAEPVDLRARYGLAPEVPVVLFFGILAPSKGLPDLIEAMATVSRSSDARLLVAGYPSKFIDMDEIHALVAQLGLQDRVIFDSRYIPIEEVAPLMALADLAVYPYRSSTQSGALHVAYAFGVPVIATRVGGLPEAVEEGRSGLLVPPEDHPALAEAILSLLEDRARAAEIGTYARHLSETRYAWRPIADQVLSVYGGLLEK